MTPNLSPPPSHTHISPALPSLGLCLDVRGYYSRRFHVQSFGHVFQVLIKQKGQAFRSNSAISAPRSWSPRRVVSAEGVAQLVLRVLVSPCPQQPSSQLSPARSCPRGLHGSWSSVAARVDTYAIGLGRHQPPACCTYQRRRAACPKAPCTVRTPYACQPRACAVRTAYRAVHSTQAAARSVWRRRSPAASPASA